MRYLLDANAVIVLLRQSSLHLLGRVKTLQKVEIGIPVIVMHELFFDAYKSQQTDRNLAAFHALQRDFPVVDFTSDDARVAGAIRAELARAGTPIGPYDVLIAGQAKARDLCVVTNNTREFGRVAGLKVEDWTTS